MVFFAFAMYLMYSAVKLLGSYLEDISRIKANQTTADLHYLMVGSLLLS